MKNYLKLFLAIAALAFASNAQAANPTTVAEANTQLTTAIAKAKSPGATQADKDALTTLMGNISALFPASAKDFVKTTITQLGNSRESARALSAKVLTAALNGAQPSSTYGRGIYIGALIGNRANRVAGWSLDYHNLKRLLRNAYRNFDRSSNTGDDELEDITTGGSLVVGGMSPT